MNRQCFLQVDENGRELQPHGSKPFPCTCYSSGINHGNVPWHWHEDIEILYVTKGCVQGAVGSKRFLLTQGDAIFVNAGIPHAYFQLPDTEYEEYDIVFHPRLLYGDVASVYHEKYLAPLMKCTALSGFQFSQKIPWERDALHSIQEAIFSCHHKNDLYEFTVRNELSKVCALLWQHIREQSLIMKQTPSIAIERTKQMLDYFHLHYQETVTLEALAQQANICKRECQRTFRSILGLSPTQYFEQYRLSMSVHLLKDSHDSITEIAGKCGFQSPSYFTKLFREKYGVTPSAFRLGN